MAIAPTGAIYKALKFDGVSSRTYGVYITGEAVYNAPERDVEMITIPGRNGSFALDNGRFQNIEVSYPAGIFADTEADFRQAISDFRNFLCSRNGYVRLQDEYNPDEYRMAVYKSGLEVDPAMLKAGEFKITFDCKPQRWLTSGETEVAVGSGDALTNPTLFESSPLLEIKGYGTIEFNGYEIELENVPYGEIQLTNTVIPTVTTSYTKTFDTTHLITGDSIYFKDDMISVVDELDGNINGFTEASAISTTNMVDAYARLTTPRILYMYVKPNLTDGFTFGTASTKTASATFQYQWKGGTFTETIDVTVGYDGNGSITITATRTGTLPQNVIRKSTYNVALYPLYAYSTEPLINDYVYCDTDIGEFYRLEGGEYISMNHVGDLGSDLPTLAPGTNTVTYDNTITELNIAPRWWKI